MIIPLPVSTLPQKIVTDLVIVTNAIHSVGAGASLLSAMGVGKRCVYC